MKKTTIFYKGFFLFVYFTIIYPTTYAADNWITASDMLHPRHDHCSTLLQNGYVLITCGDSQEAELFDPEIGEFTSAGSMIFYHSGGATATLLDNGTILIAGGMGAQQCAELYDPQTKSFQQTDSLKSVHSFHTATLLSDGRVLIAGGQDQNGPQTHAVCEIYDPETKTFSLADSLNVDRSGHTATLLPNGQVLVVAGFQTTTPGNGSNVQSCELYDPVNDTFNLVQSLNQPRGSHKATMLNNGLVLISCGSWNQLLGELYDYTTNSWALTGEMTVQRQSSHTATLLNTGKVLLAGGYVDSPTLTAELYDPYTNTFTAIDTMFTAREQHAATKLSNGNVLVTGGYGNGSVTSKAEVFMVDTTNVTSIDRQEPFHTPESFQLLQNYPNPFNGETMIQYQLNSNSTVKLEIYNMFGQHVITLFKGKQTAGQYSIKWNCRNQQGGTVSSGIYFCRLVLDNTETITKRLLYLK